MRSSRQRSGRCNGRTTISASSIIAREHARTDWDRDGLPRKDWEALLDEAKDRADRAGFYRFAVPKEFGGEAGSNLWMR